MVAAHDEVVLVLLGPGVGAAVDVEVLAEQPGRQGHQGLGVVELLRLPVQHTEEPLAVGVGAVAGDVDQHAVEQLPRSGFISADPDLLAQPQDVAFCVEHAIRQLVLVGLLAPAHAFHVGAVLRMHDRRPELAFLEPALDRMTEHPLGVPRDEGQPPRPDVGLPHHRRETVDERTQLIRLRVPFGGAHVVRVSRRSRSGERRPSRAGVWFAVEEGMSLTLKTW